jgi:diguanylate cyclase (GGDEF)-like protein
MFAVGEYRRALSARDDVINRLNERNMLLEMRNRRLCAEVCDKTQAIGDLEREAIVDPLTEVYNRRYLSEQIATALSSGTPFCVAMIDIDYFKKINDNFGHNTGDTVLKLFSRVIAQSLTERDVFGRYGGEEFLVIFRNQAMTEALAVCRGLYPELENTNWSIPVSVTISVGIVEYDGRMSYAELLDAADKSLYAAKSGGRNRISVAEPVGR